MAVTQEQLTAAQEQEASAYTAWQSAEAELQSVITNPDTPETSPQGQAAKNKAIAANKAYQAAVKTNTNTKNQYSKENPTQKPQTPAQQTHAQSQMTDDEQRAWNNAHFGLNKTNAEVQAIMQSREPKPPTTPNAVQTQNSQTSMVNAAETGRHNQELESQARVEAQIKAQNDAITASNNRRNQIGQEAVSGAQIANTGIGEVRSAATTLLTSDENQQQRLLEQAKARNSYFDSVNTGVMSGVLKLITMGKNGSKAAAAFATAYMAMANTAYHQSGLDTDIPKIDMNSPEVKALKQISGYTLPDQLPTIPSTSDLDWRTAKSQAASGYPPPGWNGPIGVAAIQLPDDPATIAKTTGKTPQAAQQAAATTAQKPTDGRDLTQLKGDPDAEKINQDYKASVAALMQTPQDKWTPAQHQEFNTLSQNATKQLQDLYDKKFRNKNTDMPGVSSGPSVVAPNNATSELGQPGDPGYVAPDTANPPSGDTQTPSPAAETSQDRLIATVSPYDNSDIPQFPSQDASDTAYAALANRGTQSFTTPTDTTPDFTDYYPSLTETNTPSQDEEDLRRMPNFGYAM